MVTRMRRILLTLIAPLVLIFAIAPAMAASDTGYGTPAWTTRAVNLWQGPGRAYDVVGTIGKHQAVTVYRCSVLWCVVGQGKARGWTRIGHLNFGLPPGSQPVRTRAYVGYGVPGSVCLYEGRNYTGAALCIRSGHAFKDLLLQDLDNRFSSISIEGDLSADVCRDRDFQSYCAHITASQPVLHRHLDKQLSSIRVY